LRMARDLDINVGRFSSQLAPRQAERLRQHAVAKAEQRRKLFGSPPVLVSQVAVVPEQRPNAALDEPRLGPPGACACCGMRVPYDPDNLDGQPERCPPCREHYEMRGEDDARLIARLIDHDRRLRPAYAAAWTAATDLEERMKSALHSRDTWRGTLVEIVMAHEETERGCSCGVKSSPCLTIKTLQQSNRGVSRRVESFASMPDQERSAALYRRDHWDHDDTE